MSVIPVNTTTINAVATVTLLPSNSGTIYICTKVPAGGSIVTLPNPTIPGLNFDFYMTQGAVVAQTITFASPVADTMVGLWTGSTGTSTPTANPVVTTNILFTATAISTDHINLKSDGTNWRASGSSGVAAGIAFS
jgi:hypothetical protein